MLPPFAVIMTLYKPSSACRGRFFVYLYVAGLTFFLISFDSIHKREREGKTMSSHSSPVGRRTSHFQGSSATQKSSDKELTAHLQLSVPFGDVPVKSSEFRPSSSTGTSLASTNCFSKVFCGKYRRAKAKRDEQVLQQTLVLQREMRRVSDWYPGSFFIALLGDSGRTVWYATVFREGQRDKTRYIAYKKISFFDMFLQGVSERQ